MRSVELNVVEPASVMSTALLAQALTARAQMDANTVASGDHGALIVSLNIYDTGSPTADTFMVSYGWPLCIMQHQTM